MQDIKNMRRAAALYELTFLNMHGFKYDLNDILPTPCIENSSNTLDKTFNALWHTAMALGGLKNKQNKARALLGILAVKHFCAAADAICDVQEDAFNPGVRLKTYKMAAYFKNLMPRIPDLDNSQQQGVMFALIGQVRTALSRSARESDWSKYLVDWYDSCTQAVTVCQPETVLNGSILNKIKLCEDFKKRTR